MPTTTRKYIVYIVAIVLAILVVALLARRTSSPTPRIVTTFYPVSFLVEQTIDSADGYKQIVPPGIEPHDFEPTPRDIAALYDASVVFAIGADMEPWLEKIEHDLTERGVRVVYLADTLELIEGAAHSHEEDAHEDEHALDEHTAEEVAHEEEEHEGGMHGDEHTLDPHVWLSPRLMTQMAEIVLATLSQDNFYSMNTLTAGHTRLINELTALDTAFTNGLAQCAQRTFVTAHSAFGYLAHTYKLEQHSISGLSPEEEPSLETIAEIKEVIEDEGITTVFTETLLQSKVAEVLAQETGAQVAVLNPLEGLTHEDETNGKNYVSIMYENKDALIKALACTPTP